MGAGKFQAKVPGGSSSAEGASAVARAAGAGRQRVLSPPRSAAGAPGAGDGGTMGAGSAALRLDGEHGPGADRHTDRQPLSAWPGVHDNLQALNPHAAL